MNLDVTNMTTEERAAWIASMLKSKQPSFLSQLTPANTRPQSSGTPATPPSKQLKAFLTPVQLHQYTLWCAWCNHDFYRESTGDLVTAACPICGTHESVTIVSKGAGMLKPTILPGTMYCEKCDTATVYGPDDAHRSHKTCPDCRSTLLEML